MNIFVLMILSFFVMILHVFVNHYTGEKGFCDLGYCFFIYQCFSFSMKKHLLWKQFYHFTVLSLVVGFFYDIFSLNDLGTSMISFLILSCFLSVSLPFLFFHQSAILLAFFFFMISFLYQLITYCVVMILSSFSMSLFDPWRMFSVASLHSGLLSMIFLRKKF